MLQHERNGHAHSRPLRRRLPPGNGRLIGIPDCVQCHGDVAQNKPSDESNQAAPWGILLPLPTRSRRMRLPGVAALGLLCFAGVEWCLPDDSRPTFFLALFGFGKQ